MSLINLGGYPKNLKIFGSPVGNRFKTLYKYEYDEKLHCPRRVVNGKMDLQAYIQESADDVDFKNIGKMLVDTRDNVISHFQLGGETMDITRVPRNIHEYEALHNKIKDSFDNLDPEVKKLFNDNLDVFKTAWQRGNLEAILAPKQEPAAPADTNSNSNIEGGAE